MTTFLKKIIFTCFFLFVFLFVSAEKAGAVLVCDPACYYGSPQCTAGVTPKAGYSCQRADAHCVSTCNTTTGEWCWAFCTVVSPTNTPTPIPTNTPVPPTPTPCASSSGVVSFIYDTTVSNWFQTTGGDVHAKGNITVDIPACATSLYFSKDGTGGAPGFVTWEGLSVPDMGDEGGDTSSTNWNGKSYSPLSSQEYSYMLLRLGIPSLGIPTSTDTFDGNLSALTDGVYYSPTTKDITGNVSAGKKVIVFINGDANIKDNITLLPSDNGFFALVVLGNINFDNTVANAQGLFLANGIISNGTGTVVFAGQGSFIGLSGFALGRNLGTGPILNCTPAQTFVERPDFLINAPPAFKVSSGYFQEVAP